MDHSTHFGGGLDFEEDTNDIPEGLRMMAEQQQQQARLSAQAEHAAPPAPRPLQFAPPPPFNSAGPPVGLAASTSSVAPPAASNVLPPLTSIVDAAPVKRPRGRPRKIPGTESRPTAVPGSRGRPRGSRARGRGRGRGRGGKRPRPSSDEDDDGSDGSDDMDDAQERRVHNSNEEMPDDWSPSDEIVLPPTTKYGRKISKPTPFAPTTRPTIHRKKRASIINPDASLMCQVCKEGHSPKANRLVICESCSKGWHQICHDPPINEQVVSSDLSWLCKECDVKLARTRPDTDVGVGEWVMGEEGKGTAYPDEEKREWLEGLPLHALIGFILSIEQKYAPAVKLPGLAIWPQNLPAVLVEARTRKAAEVEERRIKDEAEENARIAESEGVATPSSIAEEPIFARTVASENLKRAASSSSAPTSTLPSVLAPVPKELDPRRLPPPQQQQQQAQHPQQPLQQAQPPYQPSYQPPYQQHQQQQQRQYQQPSQMPQAPNRLRSPPSPPPQRNALPPFLPRNFIPSPVLQNQPQQQQQQQPTFGHHPLQSLAPQFDFNAGGFNNDFFAAPNPHQYFQSNLPAYPQWDPQHNGGGGEGGRNAGGAGAGGAGGAGSGGVAR